jgi:hypothetical protein
MLTIYDILKTFHNENIYDINNKNIGFIIDVSGSTGAKFNNNLTVLEKEISIIQEYITKNINNNYYLFSFANTSTEHKINILKDEEIIDFPELHSNGGTNTHLAFAQINNNKKIAEILDIIILLTDGQTNSTSLQIKNEFSKFNKRNLKFEIIAVSELSIDLNKITQAEENQIPGMELINMIANSIDKLTIYNKIHKDIPYEGATSSKINKKELTFMTYKFKDFKHFIDTDKYSKNISIYIDFILNEIGKYENINWGLSNIDFKKFTSEIGKLLSVYFITFPEYHYYITKISEILVKISPIKDITIDRIIKIIKYGFDCTKNEKPIVYTNFEAHVKDGYVKKAEFSSAIDELQMYGTTLNSTKSISIPSNGICIINNGSIKLEHNLGPYPNSMDKYNNVYFGIDTDINQQAIRIAFREFCSQQKFLNKMCPEIAFYILNELSLLYLKNDDFNSFDFNNEYFIELRKLAIAQTSMEVMIAKNKYDGVGLYENWKNGKVLPVHYTDPTKYHSMLYTDNRINPLGLSEPYWWALMMSMLGLFDEQLNMYKTALLLNNIHSEKDFLKFMKDTYSNKIKGNVIFYKTDDIPISIFTLDIFDTNENEYIYVLKNHNECKTNTHYSKTEITEYVMKNGCVWCKYIPEEKDFIKVKNNTFNEEIIGEMMKKCSKLYVPFTENNQKNITNNKIVINMIGLTGSGKSTIAQKIKDYVELNKGQCLIVSADKWSKIGITGKNMQTKVFNEIKTFDQNIDQKNKNIIIIDVCNENGPNNICFGYDISSYTHYNLFANFDINNLQDFDEYQSWCLSNVLARPIHTATTNYWLNPVSAGVNTCIKVHNIKKNGIVKLLGITSSTVFNENSSIYEINNKIMEKAKKYSIKLSKIDLDKYIENYMKNIYK